METITCADMIYNIDTHIEKKLLLFHLVITWSQFVIRTNIMLPERRLD